MNYSIIFDGSGTWLVVPLSEVEASGIKVSRRSRIKGEEVFLSDINDSAAFCEYYREENGYPLTGRARLDPAAFILLNPKEYKPYDR